MRKEQARMRFVAHGTTKPAQKSREMLKPVEKSPKHKVPVKEEVRASPSDDLEHYFPTVEVAPVTTYLLIPLAPTPTTRMPLPLDPADRQQPSLLPPLSYLGEVHASYSTHSLRVTTIFTRLDQANVWARGGVYCSAYSQGQGYRRTVGDEGKGEPADEGVCTILKVEFVGWTKAEVRSVIGESGTGWCVLEEVLREDEPSEDEYLSESDSLSSSAFYGLTNENRSPPDFMGPQLIDPAQSFVLPTLDFSASFLASNSSPALSRSSSAESVFASLPSQLEYDPWVEEYPYSSSSGASSFSDLSYAIVDPPSSNGWFGRSHGLGPGVSFGSDFANAIERVDMVEPREGMFY